MPGEKPHKKQGRKWPGGRALSIALLSSVASGAFGFARAASEDTAADGLTGLFSSYEITFMALFGGAMSFALLSAFWLIRERTRIARENASLHQRVADLRAVNERTDALINVADQRIVVWNGADERPQILGALSAASGAPQMRAEFLSFGKWLDSNSSASFESALRQLRLNAVAFDLPLVSKTGGVMEAQGRTSGSHAFVRFIETSGSRAAHARLQAQHGGLQSTFELLQKLFEALPSPVWLRNAAEQLIWVNTAYAKAVDRELPEDVVADRLDLLDRKERLKVAALQSESGLFAGELPAVVAGDRRMLGLTEVRDEHGTAGIAFDRSETQHVKATLRQTIASHQQTLDQLQTAVAMFDARQKLQFYNASFQALWGLEESFLSAQPTNAQVLDACRASHKLADRPDWRKWRDQQLTVFQALEARQDIWHLVDGQTLRVVTNPHNQGGATWVFENMTEQLELQSNYNALMRLQGETLDNLNEAVAVFGANGKLRLCNPAFVTLWRLEPGQHVAGTHISRLSGPCRARLTGAKSGQGSWEDIVLAITGLNEQRGDVSGRLETVDGAALDYSIVPLPDGQTMLTFTDVTAQVNVERALHDRNEALEQSDILKNRFLQHVSLELRAPLTTISGFAEMLAMPEIGKFNPKQAEYLSHISAASNQLKVVVDDILDLATIDAGAMEIAAEPTAIAPVVETCLSELAGEMAAHGVRTEVQIGAEARMVIADPARLTQIIHNLLSNAISVSPDGGLVTIASTIVGEMVEISVSDNGPGVSREDRQWIFNRFEARSVANRRKGPGLGLSIVMSFVSLHGGTVHVEDAEQRGAKFVCRFPGNPNARPSQAADRAKAA